jgi:hypothetical protein
MNADRGAGGSSEKRPREYLQRGQPYSRSSETSDYGLIVVGRRVWCVCVSL